MAITLFAGAAALLAAAGTAFALRRGEGGRIGSPAAALLAFMSIVFGLWADKTNLIHRIVAPRRVAQQPVLSDEEKTISNWNVRGAIQDSMRYRFDQDWVFPFRDGHLTSVEILSWGEIWPAWNDTNAVARIGIPLEIRRGTTAFSVERTEDNAYLFSWDNAIVDGDTDNPVSASIRLDRNGDITVTTNGVSTFAPRVLPFAHDGFGQDETWVCANFTNAEEILSTGYPQWVDAQVGHNLANGLYKFTAIFDETPPETLNLTVGDFSIAVTNSGEYAFLLEKGREYDFGTEPFFENVRYSYVDDIPARWQQIRLSSAEGETGGRWTEDGGIEFYEQTSAQRGLVVWMPCFKAFPDVLHISPGDFPKSFIAILSDFRGDETSVAYRWTTGNENISIATPSSRETLVGASGIDGWDELSLSVQVEIAGRVLHSTLEGASFGRHEQPVAECSIAMPRELIVRSKWMPGSVSARARIGFVSDIATNGTLAVGIVSGSDKIDAATPAPVVLTGATAYSGEFAIDGIAASASADDVAVRCEFTDEAGRVIAAESRLTVIDPQSVMVPDAPETGMCVLKDSSVRVALDVAPAGFNPLCFVDWFTAKRRNNGDHDAWGWRLSSSSLATGLSMDEAGCFTLSARLVCGCQSNETVYVHAKDEPDILSINDRQGPCRTGWTNHIGVASTQALLNIRNAALSHLNLPEYGKLDVVPSRNGFDKFVERSWKCNRFVADVACAAGCPVPAIHITDRPWPIPDGRYPPLANEWAAGSPSIQGWVHLGNHPYPEPGFIAGRPEGGIGHCGIVDYDGWTISAREFGVSRNASKMLDGTIRYNKPEENENEN